MPGLIERIRAARAARNTRLVEEAAASGGRRVDRAHAVGAARVTRDIARRSGGISDAQVRALTR